MTHGTEKPKTKILGGKMFGTTPRELMKKVKVVGGRKPADEGVEILSKRKP